MKKYLLLTLAAGLSGFGYAQELPAQQVPAAVQATLRKGHPTAKQVKWEREADNYEAEFHQEQATMSVLITPTGKLLETETEIREAQLPPAVRGKLASHYAAYQITEAAHIVTAATGHTTYEAELRKPGQKMDVVFEADGTVVSPKAAGAATGRK